MSEIQEPKALTKAEMVWALAPPGTVQAGWYNSTLSYWSAAELMDGYDIEGIEWIAKPESIPAGLPTQDEKDRRIAELEADNKRLDAVCEDYANENHLHYLLAILEAKP